jgi:PAS domain-containing protein
VWLNRRHDAGANSDLCERGMKINHQIKSRTDNEAQAEQALRASELSYRRLFEAAKDGILILDVDTGRINDANPFLLNSWVSPAVKWSAKPSAS